MIEAIFGTTENNKNNKTSNKNNKTSNTNTNKNNTNKNNTNNNSINPNITNNNNKNKVIKTLKLPKDKYKFYDMYLEDVDKKIVEKFKEPIGLYDPYGKNINPLTLKPYKNNYINDDYISYNSGNLEGKSLPKSYTNWAIIWTSLPLYTITGQILSSIRDNSITLIRAGTGTGKSFLAGRICSQAFNFQKKILMTLPKKMLARKAADSTAKTCDVVLGEEVGYFFKGDYMIDKNNKESKIIFTTVGSLIRKMTGGDSELKEYSCIIIDETHERSIETDQLILFLKKTLLKRKDLKIIFISATLEIDIFKNYFSDSTFNVINMGSETTFKITDIYEKEQSHFWEKVAAEKTIEILKSGDKGDILIFIKSGSEKGKIEQHIIPEIKKMNASNKSKENPFMCLLKAGISKKDEAYATQKFLYLTHPDMDPSNPYTRKIVFATNVAESSVTVEGAVFVIDCGLALDDEYFPLQNANALLSNNISQSAVKQRRGRIGRQKPGTCYHLYSEKEEKTFIEFPIPSIRKSDLTMAILDIMKIDYIKNIGDVRKLLNEMLSPPEDKFISSALLNLYSMEAITSRENTGTITILGRAISKFSGLSIQMARAIISSYYYHCKYDVIPIVIILGLLGGRIEGIYGKYRKKKSLTNSQLKKEELEFIKKQHRFDSKYGDFLTVHNIYTEFRSFMKLPKEYIITEEIINNNNNNNNLMEGGFNNSNNNTNNEQNSINMAMLTKKTDRDGKRWCEENGISSRIFISNDSDNWDKVGLEARKVDKKLMEIIQDARIRKNNFMSYKNDGGNSTKKEIINEIKIEKQKSKTLDPENNINVKRDTEFGIDEQKELIQSGGYIQYAGYNKKVYENNFFPKIVKFEDNDHNILMSLAHGLYINYAKHINGNKYRTCYPLERSFCKPDDKTSLPLKIKPNVLLYNELFTMREGQKELKLNFITKIPNTVLSNIKEYYQKYIEDCYKTENLSSYKSEYDDKSKGKGQGKGNGKGNGQGKGKGKSKGKGQGKGKGK